MLAEFCALHHRHHYVAYHKVYGISMSLYIVPALLAIAALMNVKVIGKFEVDIFANVGIVLHQYHSSAFYAGIVFFSGILCMYWREGHYCCLVLAVCHCCGSVLRICVCITLWQ